MRSTLPGIGPVDQSYLLSTASIPQGRQENVRRLPGERCTGLLASGRVFALALVRPCSGLFAQVGEQRRHVGKAAPFAGPRILQGGTPDELAMALDLPHAEQIGDIAPLSLAHTIDLERGSFRLGADGHMYDTARACGEREEIARASCVLLADYRATDIALGQVPMHLENRWDVPLLPGRPGAVP